MPIAKFDILENPKVLSIDQLPYPKNRVAKIGVELEGAWAKLPPGVRLEGDGSVFRGNRPEQFDRTCIGELPIGPMQPGAMPKAMRKYYPSLVDHTCGMHVHMSFETLKYYGALMDKPDYQETIVEYLSRWAKAEGFDPKHHIWGRLAGKSIYCQKRFWPDDQVTHKGKDHDQDRQGHRYTIVNYCGRINTIEIRVLPMMAEVDQAIRAVKEVIRITNASLIALFKKKDIGKLTKRLELPGGYICEEFLEDKL